MKNNGDEKKMKILNIHAGTNDEDIIKFINEVKEEYTKLDEEQKKDREIAKKNGFIYEEKKIWVFL